MRNVITSLNARNTGGVEHPLVLKRAHRDNPKSSQLTRENRGHDRTFFYCFSMLWMEKHFVFLCQYRGKFSSLQFTPILQHGMDYVCCACSLSV